MAKLTPHDASEVDMGDNDSSVLSLKIPRIIGLLPLLADEDSIPSLPQSAQASPLQLEIDRWDGYAAEYKALILQGYTEPKVYVQALWNGLEVGEATCHELLKDPAALFPIVTYLPQFLLTTGGVASVSYKRWIQYIDNMTYSDPQRIRIDKTAPNFGNPCPLQGPDKNVAVIDQAYLDRNNQRAIFFLDRWSDIRLEDQVLIFAARVEDVGSPAEPLVTQTVDFSSKPMDPFPAAIAGELLSNGRYRLFCRLKDRTGNISPPSLLLDVLVNLGGGVQLPPPSVPLADDGLIDLNDTYQPVNVRIPFIDAARPGDVLQAYWNNRALGRVTVQPNQVWPIGVPVPWEIVTADGFVGPLQRAVYYQGIRQGAPLDSPSIGVMVDLRVAGPDPVGPQPENPLLKPVVVKGLNGDNHLGADDVDLPVKVQVALYERPQAGDVLELYWGTGASVVSTYQVQPHDAGARVITFPVIDYRIIESAGAGPRVPVHYWTFNGVNRQRSPTTLVNVEARPLPDFQALETIAPYVTLWGWINCDSLFSKKKPLPAEGLPFRVPGNQPNLQSGDEVQLSWQMHKAQNGQLPISPLHYFPPVRVSASAARDGVLLYMGLIEELIIKELQKSERGMEGSVKVGYRVRKADGRWGLATFIYLGVSLIRPGGAVCLGPA